MFILKRGYRLVKQSNQMLNFSLEEITLHQDNIYHVYLVLSYIKDMYYHVSAMCATQLQGE